MGIFNRISDIISANMNDLVNKWEEPEIMLQQALREMESSIEEAKQSVVKTMANEKLVAKELQSNQERVQEWHSRAESAVKSGDDALARKALSRKKEHAQVAVALQDQHTATKEASITLRHQLEAMQAKLADAKRKLGTLSARKKAADVRSRAQTHALAPELNHDAFAKFDRLQGKVEMAEAEADALCELNSATPDPNAYEPLVPTQDITLDAELLELKNKLQI